MQNQYECVSESGNVRNVNAYLGKEVAMCYQAFAIDKSTRKAFDTGFMFGKAHPNENLVPPYDPVRKEREWRAFFEGMKLGRDSVAA